MDSASNGRLALLASSGAVLGFFGTLLLSLASDSISFSIFFFPILPFLLCRGSEPDGWRLAKLVFVASAGALIVGWFFMGMAALASTKSRFWFVFPIGISFVAVYGLTYASLSGPLNLGLRWFVAVPFLLIGVFILFILMQGMMSQKLLHSARSAAENGNGEKLIELMKSGRSNSLAVDGFRLMGPKAVPFVPALKEIAATHPDRFVRESALQAIRNITGETRAR